jgi:hypothetical protein
MGVYVYIGAADVVKHSPKGCFNSRELQARDWKNHSPAVHHFI